MKPEEVGVVVLAAGRSERMKEFKALLRFDGKERFLERIMSVYSGWGCREIVVVTNQELLREMQNEEGRGERQGEDGVEGHRAERPGLVRLVINDHLEFERFYSVKLGLGAIRKSKFCFIQNVDNPFIDKAVLDQIYLHRSEEAYVSPAYRGKGGHPVLLNREQISRIAQWPKDDANLKEVLGSWECLHVDMPDDRVLVNINSMEEYQRFFI